jgi:hypothetical protein
LLSDDEFRQLLEAFNRSWTGYRKVRKGWKNQPQTPARRNTQALRHAQKGRKEISHTTGSIAANPLATA